MRLGVLPSARPEHGGIYQYSQAVLAALAERQATTPVADEVVVLSTIDPVLLRRALPVLPGPVVPALPPRPGQRWRNLARRLAGEGRARRLWRRLRQGVRSGQAHGADGPAAAGTWVPDPETVRERPEVGAYWRERLGLDGVLFPYPHTLAFEAGLPAAVAVHDLQHRLQPHFPEVAADGEWARREYMFRNVAATARVLFVDSAVGREDLLACYPALAPAAERIRVLPFLPAPKLPRTVDPAAVAAVRDRYGLPQRYLFYPAQFWPHKNHRRLVEAVVELHGRGMDVPLVLAGGATDDLRSATRTAALAAAAAGGAEHLIHAVGYVPDDDLAALYAGAQGLVFPTFFGPTNIPVLEAWALGCPVLTSDLRGIREQVGEAALLADPSDVADLAGAIERLWTDRQLRARLATAGRERLAGYGAGEFRERLAAGLAQFAADLP